MAGPPGAAHWKKGKRTEQHSPACFLGGACIRVEMGGRVPRLRTHSPAVCALASVPGCGPCRDARAEQPAHEGNPPSHGVCQSGQNDFLVPGSEAGPARGQILNAKSDDGSTTTRRSPPAGFCVYIRVAQLWCRCRGEPKIPGRHAARWRLLLLLVHSLAPLRNERGFERNQAMWLRARAEGTRTIVRAYPPAPRKARLPHYPLSPGDGHSRTSKTSFDSTLVSVRSWGFVEYRPTVPAGPRVEELFACNQALRCQLVLTRRGSYLVCWNWRKRFVGARE